MTPVADGFVAGVVRSMGADVALLGGAGTSAVAHVERAGTRRVACYQAGGHTFLPCDPAVLERVRLLDDGEVSLLDVDFRGWATEVGAEVLGQAVMKVAGSSGWHLTEPVAPVHRFDWSNGRDVELMQAFVDSSTEDDLDEAEVAMDDLDDQAVGLLGADGSIQAFASARPYDDGPSFGDIGIVASPTVRGRGWGRSAVSALIQDVLVPAGVEPLYRCDVDNLGSHRLSQALGFETVVALTVVELPEE